MLWPQMMTISAADFFGDALQSGRAHLARGPNREPVTRNQEGLAAMDPARSPASVPERPRFPALIERLQTLGDTIGRRRDLIGVDGVELPRVGGAFGSQKINARPRTSARGRSSAVTVVDGCGLIQRDTRLQPGRFNAVHRSTYRTWEVHRRRAGALISGTETTGSCG